mmetsp:Transcript_33061/g.43523  ORF Transcript_33061/g.43523 Transcript_33061/m.43523 type:complete len:244 (-) Transcript_33061:379-1110(-)
MEPKLESPPNYSTKLPRKSTRRSCPDFLSKLVQILSMENPDIIMWQSGRIYLRDPAKLMSQILKKYFRHANYNSFKRQLNYFGFRKIDGKGKFEPCVYHNEELEGKQVEAITKIKRKTSTGPSYMMFPYDELKVSPPSLYAPFSSKNSYLKKKNAGIPSTAPRNLMSSDYPSAYPPKQLSESKYIGVTSDPSPLTSLKYERVSELAPHSRIDTPRQSLGLQCLIRACELHLAQANSQCVSSSS